MGITFCISRKTCGYDKQDVVIVEAFDSVSNPGRVK